MRTRPRTKFVLKLKARRCPTCGSAIAPRTKRCKRCHTVQSRPKK